MRSELGCTFPILIQPGSRLLPAQSQYAVLPILTTTAGFYSIIMQKEVRLSLSSKCYRKKTLKNSPLLYFTNQNNILRHTVKPPTESDDHFGHTNLSFNRKTTRAQRSTLAQHKQQTNHSVQKLQTGYSNYVDQNEVGQEKRLTRENMEIKMVNIRLEKENLQLAEALKEMEYRVFSEKNSCLKLDQIRIGKCEKEGRDQDKDNRVQLLQKIQELQLRLQSTQKASDSQTSQTQRLNQCIARLQEELIRYRQTALMQREDYTSHLEENQTLNTKIKKYKDTNRRLYNQLRAARRGPLFAPQIRTTQFGHEQSIFRLVVNNPPTSSTAKQLCKDSIQEPSSYPFYYPRHQRSDLLNNLEAIYQQGQSPPVEYNYKPSFFSFISEEFESKGYYSQALSRSSTSLLSLLRCILDSYYNTVLVDHDRLEAVPDFPEYVYYFNTRFWYNSDQKRCESKVRNPVVANCEFYVELMRGEWNNNWEVVTFREFLLQTSTFECLFFYLQVRSYLLGHDLSCHISSHFETFFYCKLQEVESTARLFLAHIKKTLMSTLYSSLKASSLQVNTRRCVQSGFALRLLVEFHRAHLHHQSVSLTTSLNNMTSNKQKNQITFLQFSKLVQHKFKLSHLTLIGMYRRCSHAGQGVVGATQVLQVIREKRLFCVWVLKKNCDFRHITELVSFQQNFDNICCKEMDVGKLADDLGISTPGFVEGTMPSQLRLISNIQNIVNLCFLYIKKQTLQKSLNVSLISSSIPTVLSLLFDASVSQQAKQSNVVRLNKNRVVITLQKAFRRRLDMDSQMVT